MRIFSFRLARFALAAAALGTAGCKRQPAPAPAVDSALPSASAAPLPAPEDATVCRRRPDFGISLEAEALLGERASRRIDLGELHGEPETPSIAAVGERLIVALRTTDAAGFTIKLGS